MPIDEKTGLWVDQADPQDAIRQNMSAATGASPDRRAEALRLSSQTGVPASAVESDPERAKRLAAVNTDHSQLIVRAPGYSKWLSADQNNAVLSQDDLDRQAKLAYRLNRPSHMRSRAEDKDLLMQQAEILAAEATGGEAQKAIYMERGALDEAGWNKLFKDATQVQYEKLLAQEKYIASDEPLGLGATLSEKLSAEAGFTLPFLSTLVGLAQSSEYKKDIEDFKNNRATDAQKIRLENAGRMAQAAMMRGQTWGGRISGATLESLKFMGEFALGGVGGGIAEAGTWGAKAVAAAKATAKAVPTVGALGIARGTVERTTDQLGFEQGPDGNYTLQVQAKGQSFPVALTAATVDQFKEIASEMAGELIPGSGALEKALFKRWAGKYPGGVERLLKDMAKNTGFHGVPNEVLEEQIGSWIGSLGAAILPVNKEGEIQDPSLQYGGFLMSGQEALDTAFITAISGGAMGGLHIARQRSAIRQQGAELKGMIDEYEQLKLKQRSPEKAKEMVAAASEGTENKSVFINTEAWKKYHQEQGNDPEQMAASLAGPDAWKQAEANGRLEVPLAEYLDKFSGTEDQAALAKDTALHADMPTENEHQANQEQAKKALADIEGKFAQDSKSVAADLMDMLEAVGYDKEQASTQAALIEKPLADLAVKISMDRGRAVTPWDIYRENPLVFRDLLTEGNLTDKNIEDQLMARGIISRRRGEVTGDVLARMFSKMNTKQKQESAMFDPKTGLLGEAAHAFHREAKNIPEGHDLAHLQMEGVKYINDTVSHDAGDHFYRVIAQAIRKVEKKGLIQKGAKVGGDFEFFIPKGKEAEVEAAIKAELPSRQRLGDRLFDLTQVNLVIATGLDSRAAREAGGAVKEARVASGTYTKRGDMPAWAFPKGEGPVATTLDRAPEAVKTELTPELEAAAKIGSWQDVFLGQDKMLNAAGWHYLEQADAKAFIVHADLDHLGLTNQAKDLFGSEEAARGAGDKILEVASKTMLDLMNRPEYFGQIDAAHISGDEYYFQSDNMPLLREFLGELDGVLQEFPLHYEAPDGTVFTKSGITGSYGIGVSHDDAERTALENKGSRKSEREQHGWAEGREAVHRPVGGGVDVSRGASEENDRRLPPEQTPGDGPVEYLQGLSGGQTETVEFKNWFGDSKVVDASGKPLVVYHGTGKSGISDNAFSKEKLGASTGVKLSGEGFFFVDSKGAASDYSDFANEAKYRKLQREADTAKASGDEDLESQLRYKAEQALKSSSKSRNRSRNVVEAYLSIKNPLVLDAHGEGLIKFGPILERSIKKAKADGNDGVVIKNFADNADFENTEANTHYVAFSPTQIKSAIGNRGTFDPADPNILHQAAYHGTPHKFDKFTLNHIGSGEGAQAYGYGLYFAGNKAVAEWYREKLSGPAGKKIPKDVLAELKAMDYLGFDSAAEAVSSLRAQHQDTGNWRDAYLADDVSAATPALDAYVVASLNKGSLYTVDIPEDSELLDYDKPLSEQPAGVREKLEKLKAPPVMPIEKMALEKLASVLQGIDPNGEYSAAVRAIKQDAKENGWDSARIESEMEDLRQSILAELGPDQIAETNDYLSKPLNLDSNATGKSIYMQLSNMFGGGEGYTRDGDKLTSEALLSIGIPGLRYLDGSSRGKGKGNHNYVIWDEASIEMMQTLEQSEGDRGSLTVSPGRQMFVEFSRAKDISTGIHEIAGHYILELTKRYATEPGASPLVVAHFQAIKKYLGIGDDNVITREQHELYADSMVKYFEEGKAPSHAMRSHFRKVSMWLLGLSDSARNWKNIELTPEIRELFDLHYESDSSVAEALQNQHIAPLPGINDEDYIATMEAYADEAKNLVLQKNLELWNKRRKAWAEGLRDSIEAKIRADVQKTDIYRTIQIISTGKDFEGKEYGSMKIDQSYVPAKDRSLYPKGILVKEGGLPPDVVAGMLGYAHRVQGSAGGELLRRLREEGGNIEQVVKNATDMEFDKQAPAKLSQDEIPEEVQEAVHIEQRSKVLAKEFDLLRNDPRFLKQSIKRVARRPATVEQVRSSARRIIGNMAVGDIKQAKLLRAEIKAANEAATLLAKGDVEGAIAAKERELLMHEMYRASIEVMHSIEKSKVRAKMLARSDEKLSKTRDMGVVLAARSIMAEIGLAPKLEGRIEEAKRNLAKYDPAGLAVAERLENVVMADGGHYLTMPASQFMEVVDGVESLWKMAKRNKTIRIRDQAMELDEAVAGLTAQAETMRTRDPKFATVIGEEKSKVKDLTSISATLRRVEAWADYLDGGKPDGPFKKYITTPIANATAKFRAVSDAKFKKLDEIAQPLKGIYSKTEPVAAEELGITFLNKSYVIGMMLHLGNQSNYEKLIRGEIAKGNSKFGSVDSDGNVDDTNLRAFIARAEADGTITKADWDFVQGVWDLLEDIKVDAQHAHYELYGTHFAEIKARPIETTWGTIRGGYYPAVRDAEKSAQQMKEEDPQKLLMESGKGLYPAVDKGFTKQRTEAADALSMDLGTLPSHIDKVLRFAYLYPTLQQTYRITHKLGQDKQLMGDDFTAILRPWMNRTAMQRMYTSGMNKDLDKHLRRLRTMTGLSQMALNVMNTTQQFTGLFLSGVKVKPSHLMSSLRAYTFAAKSGGKNKLTEMVLEKSQFMRTRMDGQMLDVSNGLKEFLLTPDALDTVRDFASKNGYVLQTFTQSIVDTITWNAAYNQQTAEGATEQQAIDHADTVVRLTQGSFSPEDVAQFETGSPGIRLFTMFYGYFNMQANLLGNEFAIAMKEAEVAPKVGRLAYVATMGLVMPSVISAGIMRLFYGWGDDDDEDVSLAERAVSLTLGGIWDNLLGMVPVVGSVGKALTGVFTDAQWDDRMNVSPVVNLIDRAVIQPAKLAYHAVKDDMEVKPSRAVGSVAALLTVATGIPLGAVGKAGGYVADVAAGEKEPKDTLDVIQGLTSGR